MKVLTIAEAKEKGTAVARQNGHSMRRWVRGRAERYRSSCQKCGSELIIRSKIFEGDAAELAEKTGVIIGHCEYGQRGWDYTVIEGTALSSCRLRGR